MADTGTIDPITKTSAKRVPSKTQKALFAKVEKLIKFSFLASLATLKVYICYRKVLQHFHKSCYRHFGANMKLVKMGRVEPI